MNYIIENFIKNMNKVDINNFAIRNNINLSSNELDFIYSFIKNNYKQILNNPNEFNIEKYKANLTEDNYYKIDFLVNKYKRLL